MNEPAIKNEYAFEPADTPFELPAMAEEIRPSFMESSDLAEVEGGIRTIDRTTAMMRVVQGIAILKAESLWNQSGAASLRDYRIEAHSRYGLSRGEVSRLRKIGYAWMDHSRLLKKVDLSSKARHLYYLQDAIDRYGDKKLAVKQLEVLTVQEFQAWARGSRAEKPAADRSVTVGKSGLKLDGISALSYDDSLPDEERAFIGHILKAAYKARTGGGLAHVVSVYDEGEARAIDLFIKKRRAGK